VPNRWEYDIKHLTKEQIMYAIQCDVWQEHRLYMKGKSTQAKLILCETWLRETPPCEHCTDEIRVHQIDNYINALKRGGQLDLEGNIVR
jgi:hypothetical protein